MESTPDQFREKSVILFTLLKVPPTLWVYLYSMGYPLLHYELVDGTYLHH